VALRSGKPVTWASWVRDADARDRVAVWVGWATLATYWGLATASFLLRTISDPTADVADAVLARLGWGAYPTVGAVIVARRPRNPVGWLCCAVGLLLGPAFFAQDYAWYALVHQPGSLPGGLAMAWLGQWPWRVVLGLLSFLLLLFPSGHLVSARWRPVAWAAAAGTVLLALWAAFAPRPLEGAGLERLTNPLGIHGWETIFKVLQAAAAVLLVATVLAAASMVVRFRRARGEERQQLKWLTYAAVLSVLVWLVFIVTGLVDRLPVALGGVIALIWLVAVPAAIGVAMLHYRLYDIDRLINRTVVYGLLTALLAGAYAGLVLMLGQVFGRSSSLAVAVATLTVAAAFQPARRRIQQAVDRRFNRRRYDAAKTIAAFSARLRQQLNLETLTAELLAVVDQTMEPTTATLWLRPSPDRSVEPSTLPTAGSTTPEPVREGL
jgi:MFS family permease